jgi:hypothetical protein
MSVLCPIRLPSSSPVFPVRPSSRPQGAAGKHDGFRIMARRADGFVRLLTRKGKDFSLRFPQIVAAASGLIAPNRLERDQ